MLKKFLPWFLRTLFAFLFLSYVFFSVLEEFYKGFVRDYFNLHWLLAALLITGILMLFWGGGERPREMRTEKKPRFLIFLAAVVTWVITWTGAHELVLTWRLILSVFGALVTMGILLVLFEE